MRDHTHFVCGSTVSPRGEIETHWSLDDMIAYMRQYRGTWIAHHDGKSQDALVIVSREHELGRSRQCTVAGGRITSSTGDGLTLVDSSGLVPLDDVYCAELAGIAYERQPRDNRGIEEWSAYRATITRRMLLSVQQLADSHDIDLRRTLGSTSWATAARRLGLPMSTMYPALDRRIREGYYGGRCEVFGVIADTARCWDIESAYPMALQMPVPTGTMTESGSSVSRGLLSTGAAGIYAATIDVPQSHVPPLPWRYHDRTYYPYGRVSGVWTGVEIAYALTLGCSVVRVYWSITWSDSYPIYASLVSEWTSLRASLGTTTAVGRWLRGLGNTLPGKLAERGERESIQIRPDMASLVRCKYDSPCRNGVCICGAWRQIDEWGDIWAVPYYRPSTSAYPHHAAHVTAYIRIALHSVMCQYGEALRYTDTDSAWVTSRSAPRSDYQWRLKSTWTDCRWRGPRRYMGTDSTQSDVVRVSGTSMSGDDWRAGGTVPDGTMGLVQAAARGGSLLQRKVDRWSLRPLGRWVGTRLLNSDGSTSAPSVEQVRERGDRR